MQVSALFSMVVLLQAGPADDEQAIARWMEFYAREAGAYRVFLDEGDEQIPLRFESKGVLQYTNTERERGQHGAVFVWAHRGRPEAVGSIWSIRNRNDPARRRTAHELTSLSLSPLRALPPEIIGLGKNGRIPQWAPTQAGIRLIDFPESPRPATSVAARLIQMRRLARGFSAVRIDRDGSEQALRLLPQPLLRYGSDRSNVADGGLFALASGTDPELLLVIELRESNGSAAWQFAAARFSGRPLRLELDERVVWQCPAAQTWVGSEPYFFCVGVSEHDAQRPVPPEE